MQNIALSWQQSALLAGGLAAVAVGLHVRGTARTRRLVPWVRESAIIAGLYSMWQLAGTLSVVGTSGAFARARWIERFEHDLRLPSEATVQHGIISHSALVQACNIYYATAHFGGLFLFLLWLFVRHRDQYGALRTTLAWTTLLCLVIELMPVAPPRKLPNFTDTAAQYGQSVYSLGVAPDQLSAMPSVHVGWAALIAWAVFRLAHGPWRWLGVVHLAVTVYVVVATANHFWLDGIVAVAVLAVVLAAQTAVRSLVRRRTTRAGARTAPALADAVA